MKKTLRTLFVSLIAALAMLCASSTPLHATTATGNYVCDNSTLANFQSWSGAIHSAFINFGWTQTSDTGQTIPSAAASVPSNNYLYLIYKANDALASSMPIYVKYEYGYSSTSPRVRFTVGTSSDGAGNITGITISNGPWEVTQEQDTNKGSTLMPSYFSGSAGEMRIYMWSSTTSGVYCSWFFGIERSKDATGTDTGQYITTLWGNNSSANAHGSEQVLLPTQAGPYIAQIDALGISGSPGTLYFNGSVAALPIFPLLGQIGNPMLGWMGVVYGDISNGSTDTVSSMYGSTHTYIGIAPSASGYWNQVIGGRQGSNTTMAILMRYE